MTPNIANRLIDAIDRAELAHRIANLADLRAAFEPDGKRYNERLKELRKRRR